MCGCCLNRGDCYNEIYMKRTVNNLQETQALAIKLARQLKGGEVIGLIGDLGAGKTTFTQALAKALGVTAIVNSPTFVLMKVYGVDQGSIKELIHVDAYRLTQGSELENIGLTDYISRPDVLVVIEWADRIKDYLPKNTKYYHFVSTSESSREISGPLI